MSKAKEDGVISDDEAELISQIEFDAVNIQKQLDKAMEEKKSKLAIKKLFQKAGDTLIKNAISTARNDSSITNEEKEIIEQVILQFEELGWDMSNWKKRIWFVFKIVIFIDDSTNISELLDSFDKKFCLRNVDPITGLCLGTNHFVINDIDVTLLAFTLDPRNEIAWVRKGAFSFLEFDNVKTFKNQLRRTAQDLLAKYYNPDKIKTISNL